MKYTLITGASSGIGAALAVKFAQQKHNLILVARRVDVMNQLKMTLEAEHHVQVIVMGCDLQNMQAVHQFYQDTKKYDIELWINNAGFGDFATAYNMVEKLDKIENMLDLNIKSLTVLSALYAADYADVSGSQLINVSSTAGYKTFLGASAYAASKHYVSVFTESLDRELQRDNKPLRAKVLAPGSVATEFAGVARDDNNFDYAHYVPKYHQASEIADFAFELYQSNEPVGKVNIENYTFQLMTYQYK